MRSTMGIMKNRPGPQAPISLPRRNITPRSYSWTILMAAPRRNKTMMTIIVIRPASASILPPAFFPIRRFHRFFLQITQIQRLVFLFALTTIYHISAEYTSCGLPLLSAAYTDFHRFPFGCTLRPHSYLRNLPNPRIARDLPNLRIRPTGELQVLVLVPCPLFVVPRSSFLFLPAA